MTTSNRLTVAVLVDGLRTDSLGQNTPFLVRKASLGAQGTIVPPLSFCLHPTWFAGLRPESSQKFLAHTYAPGTPLKYIPFNLERIKLTSPLSAFLRRHFLRMPYPPAPRIPFRLQRYFDLAEKLPPWDPAYLDETPTLFDVLRANGRNWLYIGSPGSDQRTDRILSSFSRQISLDCSFAWLHFGELDWASHSYGPNSQEAADALTRIDTSLEKIDDILGRLFSSINFVVFGDHGHAEVRGFVDFGEILSESLDHRNSGFISFLDSTSARFWFTNNSGRARVRDLLNSVDGGRIVIGEEGGKQPQGIQDPVYGELLWVADGGRVIRPNFWQGENRVKGMHGYLREVSENWTSFILWGPLVSDGTVGHGKYELVDMFPTMLDLLRLRVPSTNQGVSILKPVSPGGRRIKND